MKGTCSTFGGLLDRGMTNREGLSLYWTHIQCDQRPDLFTPEVRGMDTARRLRNTDSLYCAFRFENPGAKDYWRSKWVRVFNPISQVTIICSLVDYGPHPDTGRGIDLSDLAAQLLGVSTNGELSFDLV